MSDFSLFSSLDMRIESGRKINQLHMSSHICFGNLMVRFQVTINTITRIKHIVFKSN